MIILFFYLFISLNSVFSSEQENIPNYRRLKDFGKHGKEAFSVFYDYYNNHELLEKIKTDHSGLNFEKILKDDNKENLEICFGWSESLTLNNKFVKTNLVEFIRYSPLYFQSVVKEIKEKQKPQISKEKIIKKTNLSEKINSSKIEKDDVFFKKYLSCRWLPLVIGSGLFLPGLFVKKESKIKIPLSLLLAFSGGGAFWMWQQQKIKELKDTEKLEEGKKQEEFIENEIKENDVLLISREEVDEYYKKTLITEVTESKKYSYSFANKIIEKLVMDSDKIYNQIGKEVKEEEAKRAKELLRQEEEKKKQEEADLENTINTNLNQKNREALNKELEKIAEICSSLQTKYHKALDSIKINEENDEKKSLIKNIFKLIHISLKQEYFDEDLEEDFKIKIPECEYKIFFDEKDCLNISGEYKRRSREKISYKTVVNKEDNIITKELSNTGFYYKGFQDRGGRAEDQKKHFYHLPSMFKDEKGLNTDSINKLFDLILSYKYESIDYNEKVE